MSRTKLLLAGALALAVVFAATPGFAQGSEPRNQTTYFTFSAPFELPGGKTLPAGRYAFELLDSPSNRHIVKIMSEDQSTLHAMVMAIPAQRMEPSDEPEVRFMETPANQPPAIRTWWYPGRTIGHEFIYPKDQARRLAANQAEPVLTTAGDDADMKTASLARVDREGRETPLEPRQTESAEAAQAEQPMPSEQARTAEAQSNAQRAAAEARERARASGMTEQRQPETAPQPAPERESAAPRRALPQTASVLPLIALIGLGSLAGGSAVRRYRKR